MTWDSKKVLEYRRNPFGTREGLLLCAEDCKGTSPVLFNNKIFNHINSTLVCLHLMHINIITYFLIF